MNQLGKKKWISVMISAVMIALMLTACTGNNGGNQSASPGTNSGGEASASAGQQDASKPVELNIFVNHSWFPVSEWSGSIPEMITEKTGVKLNVTLATDDKQLPLMIASGNYPDLIFTASEHDRLANPDISYDWGDLIQKYAPDFKMDKTRIAINTAADGKYYTIRNNFATKEEWAATPNAVVNSSGLGLRKDVMEELGNPTLNNFDDFEKLLGTVKSKYPDMIPLMLDRNWGLNYFKFQEGLPSVYTDLYQKDGKVQYFLRDPKMLDVYKFINRLYREGYILTENFAFKDTLMDNDYALKGDVFAYVDNTNDIDNLNGQIKSQGDNFLLSQLTTPLGSNPKMYYSSVGWAGVYITKNNKDPEASIKFMQYMFSEEGQKLGMWGIEGTHWKWSADGNYPEKLYEQGDINYINQEGIGYWGLMSNSATMERVAMTSESDKVKKMATDYAEIVPELGLLVPASDSKEGLIKSKLDEMVKTEEVKIFMAKSEEAAVQAYNDMMAKAEQIGLSAFEAWATEKYNGVIGMFK